MHTIRNDTSCLLQTVYLAEIGIQSLQDYEEKGGVSASSPLMLHLSDEDEGVGLEGGASSGGGGGGRGRKGGKRGREEVVNGDEVCAEPIAKRRYAYM